MDKDMKKYGMRAGRRLEKLRIMSENVPIRPEIMLIVRKKERPQRPPQGRREPHFAPCGAEKRRRACTE